VRQLPKPRLRSSLGALVILLVACASSASTPSTSDRLPEHRHAPIAFPAAARPAAWTKSLSTPTYVSNAPFSTFADGAIVLGTADGALCAFAEQTGHARWCVRPGSTPAYGSGEVAYIEDNRTVAAVDARTGRHRWRTRFSAPLGEMNADVRFVAPSGMGSFVTIGTNVDTIGTNVYEKEEFRELSPRGAVRWRTSVCCGVDAPVSAPPYVLLPVNGSGARIDYNVLSLWLQARRIGEIPSAMAVLGVRSGRAVFWLDPGNAPQPYNYRLSEVDLTTGDDVHTFELQPDFDENNRRFEAPGQPGYSEVRPALDGRMLYLSVATRLYLYDLDVPDARPIALTDDGARVGDPVHGVVFVSQADGVWMLRPAPDRVDTWQIAPPSSRVTSTVSAGDDAFLGFHDGHIVGVHLSDARGIFAATLPCAPTRLVLSARNVYALCEPGPPWRFFAFSR
jgi:outer membrane protein assembly factor BamB